MTRIRPVAPLAVICSTLAADPSLAGPPAHRHGPPVGGHPVHPASWGPTPAAMNAGISPPFGNFPGGPGYRLYGSGFGVSGYRGYRYGGYGGYGGYGYYGWYGGPYSAWNLSARILPVYPEPPLVGAGGPVVYAGTGTPAVNSAATLVVDFPAAAQVWVNGQEAPAGEGTQRTFFSPPIPRGTSYTFDLKARWAVGGESFEWERTVDVNAGERGRLTVARGFPVRPTSATTASE